MPRNRATERRSIFVAALLILVALTLVPAALAAKGGKGGAHSTGGHNGGGGHKGGGGSLSLVLVTDQNGDGLPNWGDTVTFDVSTTATDQPHVDLKCSQNGALVYSATAGFYSSYPWPWTQDMTLSSQMWTGGAADCTATLYYISGSKAVTLATLGFTAEA